MIESQPNMSPQTIQFERKPPKKLKNSIKDHKMNLALLLENIYLNRNNLIQSIKEVFDNNNFKNCLEV